MTAHGFRGMASTLQMMQDWADFLNGLKVKTGRRARSRSLNLFTEKYKPPYSLRVSSKNFGLENGIKSVPLYAVFCI